MNWLTGAFGLVKGALGGIWGYVAAAGAAALAVFAVYQSGKKSGQTEVIAESAKKEVENAKTAKKVELDVALTKPDDVRKRLRKYQRD